MAKSITNTSYGLDQVGMFFAESELRGLHEEMGEEELAVFRQRLAEAGVPNYEFNSWVGILVPAATPQAIVTRLNEHVVKAARARDISERLAKEGAEIVASTPEYFRKVMADETALW
ncbi:MAG: hypothetical protein EB142_01820, partial [Actinobacteria bacterium]|nr:hypothetical protein [Actinomycetota bacterium]